MSGRLKKRIGRVGEYELQGVLLTLELSLHEFSPEYHHLLLLLFVNSVLGRRFFLWEESDRVLLQVYGLHHGYQRRRESKGCYFFSIPMAWSSRVRLRIQGLVISYLLKLDEWHFAYPV